jgi:multicomponent Na+:H+ antiporter subunit D
MGDLGLTVHPSLALALGALAVTVVPRRLIPATTVGASALAVLFAVGLTDGERWHWDFYGEDLTVLNVDSLALPFAVMFTIVALLASLFGWTTMGRLERAAALGTAAAGVGVVLAGDLLTLFFFWEVKVSTVVLLILARRNPASSAAGMRYLGVHLFGGVLLLAGVLWHLSDTGSLALTTFDLTGPAWLLLPGVALSAAVIPLNAWLPDAYPQATVAGTVVLSAFTTKAAVYALARLFPGVEVLVWLGVAMAIYGVVYAILEDDIRRLLSFHIVSQVGFMVAAVGVGTDKAVNGATAHATAHMLYKGLLLMAAGAVLHATGQSRSTRLGGLVHHLPWVLLAYLVGAASISGVPLFSGFPAKELAVSAVSDGGYGTAAWLLKLASVGTFLSVALKLPKVTWFGEARDAGVRPTTVPRSMYLAMGLAAVANVALGVAPDLLYDHLPTAESFQPYTVDKVVEALTLCAFTGLGFWLVKARLVPSPNTNLDTDVIYRELPVLIRSRVRVPRFERPNVTVPAGIRTATGRWRVGQTGPVMPGWLLGGTVAAAMVLVLAVSLFA